MFAPFDYKKEQFIKKLKFMLPSFMVSMLPKELITQTYLRPLAIFKLNGNYSVTEFYSRKFIHSFDINEY